MTGWLQNVYREELEMGVYIYCLRITFSVESACTATRRSIY